MERGVTPSHPVARLSFPHHHGFPKQLKDQHRAEGGGGAALTERPGLSLAPHDFDAERDMLASEEREAAAGKGGEEGGRRRLLRHVGSHPRAVTLYPKASCDFRGFIRDNGELWSLPTEVF